MDADGNSIRIIAASSFEGDLRQRITEWKFGRRTAATGEFAELLARRIRTEGLEANLDVVTWVPTTARRRHRRGYDQAEILARATARRLRLPSRRILVKLGNTSQTGRSRRERMGDPPRFAARKARRSLNVLVVDDVVTTGSTLRSAESALRHAGYREVTLIALARTPSPS